MTPRGVKIECPNCRKWTECPELRQIVRFYNGDCGTVQCAHCQRLIDWRLVVKVHDSAQTRAR